MVCQSTRMVSNGLANGGSAGEQQIPVHVPHHHHPHHHPPRLQAFDSGLRRGHSGVPMPASSQTSSTQQKTSSPVPSYPPPATSAASTMACRPADRTGSLQGSAWAMQLEQPQGQQPIGGNRGGGGRGERAAGGTLVPPTICRQVNGRVGACQGGFPSLVVNQCSPRSRFCLWPGLVLLLLVDRPISFA